MSSDPVGKADIKVNGHTYNKIPVYAYREYRSIFIPDFTDKKVEDMPKTAKVMYRGRKYAAMKYGNPNNKRPTYDFKVQNKK